MNASTLKEEINRAPFRPFRLHVADGRNIGIPAPDYVHVDPHGRNVFVWGEDGGYDILKVLLITEIEPTSE